MDKRRVSEIILGEKYYTIDDLRYNNKAGFLFSKNQMNEFLKIKDDLVADVKTVL